MSIYLAMDANEFRKQSDYNGHYWTLLGIWRAEKIKLDEVKANEMYYRKLLTDLTFPDPTEGSNTHTFGSGRKAAKLVLKHTINRTVDADAISGCLETLRKTIGADADDVIRFKPELAITAYKALTAEQKALLAPAVTAKPGSPQLEFKDATA